MTRNPSVRRGLFPLMIIEPVRHEDLTQAMQQALVRVPIAQRHARVQLCLDLVDKGTLDARNIWIAREGPDIVGVQVCVALSGSASLFWLPSTQAPVADALIEAALDGVRRQGCKIAHALAMTEDQPWTEPLRRKGFQPITCLHQMGHSLCDIPDQGALTLRYEAYRPSLADLFAATLERTYLGSLDCPELNGARSIAEVIHGHKAQGIFHPEYWWVAFERTEPVGVVMLAEMPDGLTWEMIYIGLIPEARGRGLGREMMLHAMHALRAQPMIALVLAVDARNVPARAVYESLGFIEIDRQEALLYRW